MADVRSVFLHTAATAAGASDPIMVPSGPRAFFAEVNGSGAVSATVDYYGSWKRDATVTNGILLGSIALTATAGRDLDGFACDAPWPFVFSNVSALATGCALTDGVSY